MLVFRSKCPTWRNTLTLSEVFSSQICGSQLNNIALIIFLLSAGLLVRLLSLVIVIGIKKIVVISTVVFVHVFVSVLNPISDIISPACFWGFNNQFAPLPQFRFDFAGLEIDRFHDNGMPAIAAGEILTLDHLCHIVSVG